jgi:predicted metalloprotease
MTNAIPLRSRLAAAAFLSVFLLAPAATASAAVPAFGPAKTPSIEVTEADVAASNAKLADAYGALVSMWNADFKQIGRRFVTPQIARYTGAVRTPCGVIGSDNAEYCSADNTIFYDEVFVAGMTKSAALALGTDGDMAGIGIIAHEMGHSVAMQLGYQARDSYTNESTADCLAGAFAQQAQRDGSLEKGDLEEAFYGMSLAGDPVLEATGNRRMDAMMQRRLARESHGTKEQRQSNFRTGLNGGAKACLGDFTPLS